MMRKFLLKKYGLCIILTGLGIFILILSTLLQTPGSTVVISVNGKDIKELPLSTNTTYDIDEQGHNTLIINNNKAWIKDADCPDKLCINYGKISKNGESIICLPHKLVIRIKNTKSKEELDAIAK